MKKGCVSHQLTKLKDSLAFENPMTRNESTHYPTLYFPDGMLLSSPLSPSSGIDCVGCDGAPFSVSLPSLEPGAFGSLNQ